MEIYDRFKYARHELLHMSQEQLAKEMGVNRTIIKNFELGRSRNISLKMPMLKLMCLKYRISEDWLVNGIGEPK